MGTVDVGYIADQLNGGVDVFVIASDTISASSLATSVNATTLNSGVSVAGDLTLKIGRSSIVVASSSSLIVSESIGNIELAGVEFNILGDFTASAGSLVGDVKLGKVAANNVRIFAGSSSGDITLNTGGITAASTLLHLSAADDITIGTTMKPGGLSLVGTDVRIDLNAGGNINVAGDVMATATTGSADIDAYAFNITMNNVVAMSQRDADISFNASGDINVNNVHALAGTGTADISFTASGNIMTNDITARASSDTVWVDLYAGNNLTVKGITTATASGEMTISFSAGNNVDVQKGINATQFSNSYIDLNIDAGNDISVRSINTNGTASFATVDINFDAGGNINVGTATNLAVWNVAASSVDVQLSAGNNINVFGTLRFSATNDFADVQFSAGNNINFGNATVAGNVDVYGDSWAHLSIGASAGNVNINGNIEASASNGSASVDIWAGVDAKIKNVAVYGSSDADFDISAGRDIVTNNVTVEAGGFGSFSGSGNAWIGFFAERDITADNLVATGGESFGRANVVMSALGKIKVKDIDAAAVGSGIGSSFSSGFSAGFGSGFGFGSYGGSAARISLNASSGIDAMNLAASAVSGGASVHLSTTNGNIKTLGLQAKSSNSFAGVYLEGNTASSTITVGGPVEVSGTAAMFNASAFNVNLNGAVDLTAPSYVSMWVDAANNLVTNGNITANEAGGGFVDVALFAQKSATINGDVTVKGGAGSYVYLDIGVEEGATAPMNTVTVKGNVSVMSGMLANALINGRDVTIPGSVTVSGVGTPSFDIAAGLGIRARNNLNVAGDVLVSNPTGDAGAQYLFGGDAMIGRHIVNGGTNGWGFALFNATDPSGLATLPEGFVPGRTVTFNKSVDTNGGAGSRVTVDVQNSITTGPNGLIDATYSEFTTRANVTTNMNLKTRTMSATLKNLGQKPNVRYDNRAFVGPSSVNFNSGTVLKAASFFANGPLTFNGGFTASNLAVGVTNGNVTFGGPVNITGATPFLPTAPDLALFDIMSQRGLLPPGHGPDVQIFAQNGININQTFNVGGPSPFTKMFTNGPFNVSGLTTSAGNLLAVFSPIDTTRPIFFEDEPFPQPLGASAFFNFPTISGLPDNSNVTIVLGERGPSLPLLSGPLTIGSRGGIDIGERNMFIITRGAVSGANTVITDGIFEIVGLPPQNNVFEVPVVNEFGDDPATEEDEDDDDDEDELALGGDEGDAGEDGGVSQEGSGSESMECS
jgi:hypothetical protein